MGALGGECMTSTCCEPAECVGDSSYASCLPLSETTSEPTKAPTEASPSSSPSSSCTICDDEPTNGMKKKGKNCTDINLKKKCNKNAGWIKRDIVNSVATTKASVTKEMYAVLTHRRGTGQSYFIHCG